MIYNVLAVTLALLLASSCTTASHSAYSTPRPDSMRYMGLPPAPDCREYANDAVRPDHRAWAACMGVGYK